MPIRVLVVDDSGFIRKRLCAILSADPEINVIATAADGAEGVALARELRPDVVTLDIEMPNMDGITAAREITAARPTPILMLSSLTREGARATLDALDAGAADFFTKKLSDFGGRIADVEQALRDRVHALAAGAARHNTAVPTAEPAAATIAADRYRAVVLGTSTGGPVALTKILTALPREFPVPILLVQHMPAMFTTTFAKRLNDQCQINVREAAAGDVLAAGTALLAPGGLQTSVARRDDVLRIAVRDATPEEHYQPSVDLSFASLNAALPGQVLAIVLTGMGADGCQGARLLRDSGSTVWAQDRESSVVFGMPQAVIQAGIAERVMPLATIGSRLAQGFISAGRRSVAGGVN